MEPQVVLLTDVGDLVDGVERTVHCGTSCGVHEQWHVALQDQHAQELEGKSQIKRGEKKE